MRERCPVCGGSQQIRLPLRHALSTTFVPYDKVESIAETSKTFPCPECSPTVSKDRVQVLEHHFQADLRYEGEEGYREALVGEACYAIAKQIEKGRLMRMQEFSDRDEMYKKYRVTVGVVAPKTVIDLDIKREGAEDVFAAAVIEEAIKQIDNWGSFYGHHVIRKDQAATLIQEAYTTCKKKRPHQPTFMKG